MNEIQTNRITNLLPLNQTEIHTLITLTILTTLIGAGAWITTRALFPRFTERSSYRWRRPPILTTLIGLPIALPLIWLGNTITTNNNPILHHLGALLITLTILTATIGLTGLASRIGSGLRTASEDPNPRRAIILGSIALSLLITLLLTLPHNTGTTILTPLLLAAGLGNTILSLRKTAPTEPRRYTTPNRPPTHKPPLRRPPIPRRNLPPRPPGKQ